MIEGFANHPGRWYLIATLLPLLAFIVMLIAGTIRFACRPHRTRGGWPSTLYHILGGDQPLRLGGFIALGTMVFAALIALFGLAKFLGERDLPDDVRESRWAERFTWLEFGSAFDFDRPATVLELGYRIDALTALLFAMVTFIGSCIFLFSLGYMRDECEPMHTDHEAHTTRRGRFGRFFLYLSLFAFSMLHLLIADNLFQVFISWELVGVCSFFLIGFYYERPSASTAANKAFIMNRVGDAGFLIGLAILWSGVGTLNIQELQQRLRSPAVDAHGALPFAGEMVRVTPDNEADSYRLYKTSEPLGAYVAIQPLVGPDDHFHGLGRGTMQSSNFTVDPARPLNDFGVMPYWLLTLAGLGIFLGCIGKSAQFPLHTWLPDAMEGPTPVSALIHAATMVAAGVYLVGRCFPLFTPDVLLIIAYIGAITMVLGATIALVMTDIKRILAYSTVSQLGLMMLALGVGGWVAGLLHLITHAFFKALLFLGAGSVIHGCHHEQDVRKMGGLWRKMPITALTMLVGVLAIIGTPFFSGWYSKDMVLTSIFGFTVAEESHQILFILALLTAAMTAFYMFRMWFLTFTGTPRDPELHEHAHESPRIMTVPLIVLALCSIGIAWGWPLWDIEASYIGGILHSAEPNAVHLAFALAQERSHELHTLGGVLALAAAALGVVLAWWCFYRRYDRLAGTPRLSGPTRFLRAKWYFDSLYDFLWVRPTIQLAQSSAAIDKGSDQSTWTLDGLMSVPARGASALGGVLRALQTGQIRGYVLVLALTALVVFAILSVRALAAG